ncbi:MAG: tRNA (5-methylaminomethyl-2-thiouridine)(34)-methyltransferase MnmD [Aestuariivita sp.]|nr:tRNA (5-methylaminomethyl-2-thiouridine)(34)-methyltransferase MnmD [Aestuariivita sp.]MCY4204028.1 tRNA (5-methylaminomethyl-2-thiouridine)(34)-methyltransferase MnmD [Aestuariivita sp.]MCY4289761.1 tRNA (5-methylaminomethyl-2-thiouridine)(34)-methyltransferase MnmD [Aestuariivita sp.]MCY4347639.1 tRNA (5-methylaminomethyl-2-thiouridine)(34)-methyltransferase MnmD [Aestuariivita sp.]
MPLLSSEIIWSNNKVPISKRFDDPYFSLDDGLAEAQHVFIRASNLPERFGPDFRIAELGFGTGLNFLATWEAWEAARPNGTLTYTSFEAFPMLGKDIARALASFSQLQDRATAFLSQWRTAGGLFDFGNVRLYVVIGDARQTVSRSVAVADAWFLDGFSPAKNPELWEAGLIKAVFAQTKAGGTVTTYSAARAVRDHLETAGFAVRRSDGFGRKRHMIIGQKPLRGPV